MRASGLLLALFPGSPLVVFALSPAIVILVV